MRTVSSLRGNTVLLAVCATVLMTAVAGWAHPPEAAQAASDDWLAAAQRGIVEREYSISWAESPADGGPACYQAPNRAQGLRLLFREDGVVHLRPRTTEQTEWELWMRPVAVGRGESEMAVGPATLDVDERVATYRHDILTQRLSNQHDGLVDELTVDSRPSGGGPLRVALSFGGTVTLHRDKLGALELHAGSTPVLLLHAPEVEDVTGRRLASRFETPVAGDRLEVVVEDSDASYPVTVKVLASLPSEPDWVGSGAAASAYYGFSVATAGDVNGDGYSDTVIGAPGLEILGNTRAGVVYLYYGSANGTSTIAGWSAHGTQAWEELGHAVATAGDVNGDGYSDLAIGAPGYVNTGTGATVGAVLVYHGSATGPASSPSWLRDGPHQEDNTGFGLAVAPAGDVNGDGYSDLVVGEPYFDPGTGPGGGHAYLFNGGPSGLGFVASWGVSGSWGANFGYAVSTAGDMNGDGYSDVVIGLPDDDYGGCTNCGSAAVYRGSAGGLVFVGWLLATQDNAYFGSAVATAGDVNGDGYSDVLVGALYYDTLVSNEGVAYLYYGASTFDGTSDWFAFGEQQGGLFGSSVATAGDVNGDGYSDLMIGEPGYTGSEDGEGRVLMWLGSASGPGLGTPSNASWTTSAGVASAAYGTSVATAGDVNGDGYSDVVVGAPYYSWGGPNQGYAFSFYGGPDTLATSPHWGYESNWADSNLGMSVAAAGDVNGDGYADVIVGAPMYDSSFANEGAALVFLGSSTGPNAVSDWFARGSQSGAQLGTAVASAGDLNGDGYGDVVIGAPFYDYSAVDSGAIFVWYGSASGLGSSGDPGNADWFAISAYGGGLLGSSACSAGDVNGDGFADVAAGAPGWANPQASEGGVFVWHGSATGLGANGDPWNADWKAESNTSGYVLGTSLASAGDVNGDGYSDLVAGGLDLAVVWHGSPTGLNAAGVNWAMAQGNVGYLFGRSVAGAGDVNGDGYSDVVVGAPGYTQYYTNEGAAWAYCGGPTGLSTSACWWDTGFKQSALFGWAVASGGDLNGDGYADIATGAPGWTNPTQSEGQVRVYFGSAWGPISYNDGDWKAESNLPNASMGRSVAGVGDVNGDGFADLVAGMPGFASGQTEEGRISLFYGNGRPGVSMRPRQLASNQTTPIAPLGASDSETEFAVSLRARSVIGRGYFDLGAEVKPVGTCFDGQGLQLSQGVVDGGVGGVTITYPLSGLSSGTPYHWRVRVRNEMATNPLDPPASRWFHMPWNGWNETDLRAKPGTTPYQDPIFSDGFESGGTGAWSSVLP